MFEVSFPGPFTHHDVARLRASRRKAGSSTNRNARRSRRIACRRRAHRRGLWPNSRRRGANRAQRRRGCSSGRERMETRMLGTVRAIHVRCHPVDAFGGSNASAIAYTLGSTVHMKIVDCLAARSYGTKMLTYMHSDRASQQVVQRITRNEVFAYSTLLHEALHVQGLHNERMTECAANDAVRWGRSGWECTRDRRTGFLESRSTCRHGTLRSATTASRARVRPTSETSAAGRHSSACESLRELSTTRARRSPSPPASDKTRPRRRRIFRFGSTTSEAVRKPACARPRDARRRHRCLGRGPAGWAGDSSRSPS